VVVEVSQSRGFNPPVGLILSVSLHVQQRFVASGFAFTLLAFVLHRRHFFTAVFCREIESVSYFLY